MDTQLQIWVNSKNQGLSHDCCVVSVSHTWGVLYDSMSDMGRVLYKTHTGYPDPKDLDNLQYVIDSLLKTTTHNTKLSVIFSIKIINVVDT